ncbi:tRNA epoxyqueuosine(34) reductase QueG [Acetobacter conturbans]|uniref:Epoxyqueuosine reductase n=1 Tax=Acetobacter conturbans TaxID=1737472 RepID=A0ABX0K0Q1_9PROT|nr:tRNA epoxyqueuosine(34) reductase QueG [Acetobacter conturbans]NHN89156.1 tRNA epoxyqueuosine(34) reductase QueG [Acetobacter conturbans]
MPQSLSTPIHRLVHRLETKARDLGFDAFGICDANLGPDTGARLKDMLEQGHHGTMEWMADRVEARAHPQGLWPAVRSVISLGLSYAPEGDPLATLTHADRGNISVYARNRDYHDVIKGMLKHLAQYLVAEIRRAGLEAEVKVFVDTAPVPEKPLAEHAGLGWQGKHTNVVSRDHGSWLLLGEIYTTLDLPPTPHRAGQCGRCTRCLEVCPTNAFPAPYRLDARRCISYLTIEHAGPIPHEFREAMGNHIYGCDDCLAACPWNRFAQESRHIKLKAREDLVAPGLADLAKLDDAGFRTLFSGSPIKRIGRNRFVRNVLIAIGNSGDLSLRGLAQTLQNDPDPVVADSAAWAVTRLSRAL